MLQLSFVCEDCLRKNVLYDSRMIGVYCVRKKYPYEGVPRVLSRKIASQSFPDRCVVAIELCCYVKRKLTQHLVDIDLYLFFLKKRK